MIPQFFQTLVAQNCLPESRIHTTPDGFQAAAVSLAELLQQKGIDALPGDSGRALECRLFFDDWCLYAIPARDRHVFSLFKLREQEYDKALGLIADGDTPGITVSFIAFHPERLLQCLAEPSPANRKTLSEEISRVVSWPRQHHDPQLKAYFARPEAEGPYLMAGLYIRHVASFAKNGMLPVPQHYETIFRKQGRIPRFLEANNREAGRVVCDHRYLYLQDLSRQDQLAILATHTGNTSFHSFAAEIRFHALFLTPLANIGIPFTGHSLYASAIRADLSISGSEWGWLYPYYHSNSRLIRQQERCHPNQ